MAQVPVKMSSKKLQKNTNPVQSEVKAAKMYYNRECYKIHVEQEKKILLRQIYKTCEMQGCEYYCYSLYYSSVGVLWKILEFIIFIWPVLLVVNFVCSHGLHSC